MKKLILLAITILLSACLTGCISLGLKSPYTWQTTTPEKSGYSAEWVQTFRHQVDYWKEHGSFLREGKCAKWAREEFEILTAQGKKPYIIVGYIAPWCFQTSDTYDIDSHNPSGFRQNIEADSVDTHALVGYYEGNTLMVSDDIGRHRGTGVITPESGYWDCKLIGDFYPVLMFNREQLLAFEDRYSQAWIDWLHPIF